MASVHHLRCRHCGELMQNREAEYCPECNMYLAYRAMPLLLGLILTGHLAIDLPERYPHGLPPVDGEAFACIDEAALIWE